MAAKDLDNTVLSADDIEAAVPLMPKTTITSAASLMSMEALGVLPPPSEGWKSASQATKGQSMWLTHRTKSEWIYNMTEDKYFHLPSKTLWEKRPLESQDSRAPPFTYVRTDAFHLQALRHFAASLSSGALPLAWQSWVLFIKKKRAVSIVSAPVVEEVPVHEGGGTPVAHPEVEDRPPDIPAAPVEPAAPLPSPPEEEKEEREMVEPVANQSKTPPPPVDLKARGRPKRPGRGGGCCLCLRSSSRLVESDNSDEEVSPFLPPKSEPPRSTSMPPPSNRTDSTSTPQALGVGSTRSGWETPQETPKPEVPRVVYPADDLQTRRLQNFLAEIGRNPQRLVLHVDRRRELKTTAAFM